MLAHAFAGGWIELIVGPMFSGKSEELIRRVNRALIARQRVQVFKPAIDDRYVPEAVASHDGRSLKAVPVADVAAVRALLAIDTQVVAIDEGQFFDDSLVTLALELADHAYLLETGQVVTSGPAEMLRKDEAIRRSYLGY